MDMEVRPNHPLSLRQLRVGRHRNLRGAGMRPTKGWENLGEIVYHFTNIPYPGRLWESVFESFQQNRIRYRDRIQWHLYGMLVSQVTV